MRRRQSRRRQRALEKEMFGLPLKEKSERRRSLKTPEEPPLRKPGDCCYCGNCAWPVNEPWTCDWCGVTYPVVKDDS